MTAEDLRMWKHELRTPINHIIGYSELLLEAVTDAGIEPLMAQAKELQEAGRELSTEIEKHFIVSSNGSAEEASGRLWAGVGPLVTRVIQTSGSSSGEIGDACAQDLRRIHKAAGHLADMIKGEHGLEKVVGGVSVMELRPEYYAVGSAIEVFRQ